LGVAAGRAFTAEDAEIAEGSRGEKAFTKESPENTERE
jgi:hypothetical protein